MPATGLDVSGVKAATGGVSLMNDVGSPLLSQLNSPLSPITTSLPLLAATTAGALATNPGAV